jgi:FKBP-type peptidyl-prolyl cis-trans isomerase FkpA
MVSHIRSGAACALLLSAALLTGTGCGGSDASPTAPSANVPFSQTDLRVGTGAEATAGRRASVNYALWLYSTSAVDNKGQSIESGSFAFTLGNREAITGFDRGVTGMRVGGIRRLVVPPDLAYGAQGSPPRIPPNATLVFEVELTGVQ